MTKIIGISLIKNEDIYIERVLLNALPFCDLLIVADNMSVDRTEQIVVNLAAKEKKIEYHRIRDASESHALISGYANTDTWIFAVDGDEIYDPVALSILRVQIMAGKFTQWWQIFGNVLNVSHLDLNIMKADGFLAPPCRSMVKLFNFSAISSWGGVCAERLHGGEPVFRSNYNASQRYMMHEEMSWCESSLKCLHLCFLQRSSIDPEDYTIRKNIMELSAPSLFDKLKALIIIKKNNSRYKKLKYMRGDCISVDICSFFGEYE